MNKPVTDFLVSLADPTSHSEYNRDPSSFMRLAGLNDIQIKAILAGDKHAVRRFASEEMNDSSVHARLACEVFRENDEKRALSKSLKINDEVNAPQDMDMDFDQDNDMENNNDDYGDNDLDMGDDIAEFSKKYSFGAHYDHLFDQGWEAKSDKELVFVGTGIKGAHHLTAEAILHIETADKVLYCVADVVVERKIRQLNDNCRDLYDLYGDDKLRRRTYEEMVECSMDALKEYRKVCVVFYGHPGIFVWPSFTAIRQARQAGVRAYMLPAVSSIDCMFADLGFDPSRHGCQILEATDFLSRGKKPDVNASVIILQVGAVGDMGFRFRGYEKRNMPIFVEYLAGFYGPDYEVILYEASQFPVCAPTIRKLPIRDITAANPSGITSLYIPPKVLPPIDRVMLERLGLQKPTFKENMELSNE
ncbi:hypothetical protein CO659_22745 [Rhizobium sp. S9]|uniref:SAM-dependent methyltransferase n=1 Tax=Rhizobium sp. S9 TaxID=2035454 RepID=UPI000BE96A15|nr:SAM-dependent methyltransferase [Rhizobium sp. S9]PDS95464.1 hypothetical protein CO659_22745 [Rhizobium sp. S9]